MQFLFLRLGSTLLSVSRLLRRRHKSEVSIKSAIYHGPFADSFCTTAATAPCDHPVWCLTIFPTLCSINFFTATRNVFLRPLSFFLSCLISFSIRMNNVLFTLQTFVRNRSIRNDIVLQFPPPLPLEKKVLFLNFFLTRYASYASS